MFQKKYAVYVLALIMSILSGCTSVKNEQASVQLFAMDTLMDLKAEGKNAQTALEQAAAEINRLDALFSVVNKNSEIYHINQNAGGEPVAVSQDTEWLLKAAKQVNQDTQNAFAVTIYPVVDAWGFMKEEKKAPNETVVKERLLLVDDSRLAIDAENHTASLEKPDMAIDVGGIAKGYLSDRVTAIMKENDVPSAILSLGGNIATVGVREDGTPWRVALQDPQSPTDYIGIFEASDISIITSGGYQRYFEENGEVYHHILNPSTGYPAKSGLISVSIVSKSGIRADALSTALFVMGQERAVEFWRQSDDFEAVLVTEDKRVLATEGLSESFLFEGEKQGYTYAIISR